MQYGLEVWTPSSSGPARSGPVQCTQRGNIEHVLAKLDKLYHDFKIIISCFGVYVSKLVQLSGRPLAFPKKRYNIFTVRIEGIRIFAQN